MGNFDKVVGRNNQETIGIIMPTINNPFHYAMKSRHQAKLKEQKKFITGLNKSSANLNQKTSATQLFGASKSPFNTNVVKSVNAIKNRRGLEARGGGENPGCLNHRAFRCTQHDGSTSYLHCQLD